MLNFTVGPVQMSEEVRKIGAEQVPYFRTEEFSDMMKENESLMLEFSGADSEARSVFLTGSGTAAMEAVVSSTLTKDDKVLIVNGGSFGQRFVDLCALYQIPYTEVKLQTGHTLTADDLNKYNPNDFTAFLVNAHETSTGVHYDLDMIHSFCERANLFLIVDAISSFIADKINMHEMGIDVMITGSQKALACPPGISVVVLSARGVEYAMKSDDSHLYLSLKNALVNGTRGQTPFTPAVGILRQIHARLLQIAREGGVQAETARIASQAEDFRAKIAELPFEIVSDSLSNAVTPLRLTSGKSAYDLFLNVKDNYNIWICPNGGSLKNKIFRVGHIGALTLDDNTTLVNAFKDLNAKGLL